MIGPSVNNRSSHLSQSHRSCRQTAETCNPTHSRASRTVHGSKEQSAEVHASTVTCEPVEDQYIARVKELNETVPPFTSPGEMTTWSGGSGLIAFAGSSLVWFQSSHCHRRRHLRPVPRA